MAKDAAVSSIRDTRTVAEYAARMRALQRWEMHTLSERMKTFFEWMKILPEWMKTLFYRMKTVPELMEIVAENVPTGIAWRRPCRNPGCDRDAGHKLHKRAAPGNDFSTTHDMTHSRNM